MADATKIIDLSWLPGAETIANVIQLDLTAMDGGQTLDLVINGQAFTVRYDTEPAIGDNGLPGPRRRHRRLLGGGRRALRVLPARLPPRHEPLRQPPGQGLGSPRGGPRHRPPRHAPRPTGGTDPMTTFAPTFQTPWSDHRDRIGQTFTVVATISEPDEHHDAEVLPMYRIRFDDGAEIEAWPEEVEDGWPGWEHHSDHPLAGSTASHG